MSFASSVKDEVALKDIDYVKDQLSSLFKTSGNITISNGKMKLVFKSENSKVAKMVYIKMQKLYDVKPITSIYRNMKLNRNNVYLLEINDNVTNILDDLDLVYHNNLKNIIRSDRRIKSFLSGCFLGCGSVNDPIKTNYHLEMAFQDESFAKEVVRLVERLYMNPKLIKRRNLYVVYLKRAQEIADFIASIGATNCYLDFENYRMTRDFYNSDNRLANCDIANAVRTNMAALSQLEDIGVIKNSIGIEVLPNDLQVLCNLRLENQESSLRELATLFSEKTNKAITKSGINHLFSKVKMIADDYRGKKK